MSALGEQHLHVAGHTPCDGVDSKTHIDAAFCKYVVKFANLMLRLRNGHALAGHDHNFICGSQNGGGFFRAGAAHRTCLGSSGGAGLFLPKCAEQNV
jgi:hypothetical protein